MEIFADADTNPDLAGHPEPARTAVALLVPLSAPKVDDYTWRYRASDGATFSVSHETMKGMARCGQINGETLVWRRRMPDAKPARLTELSRYLPRTEAHWDPFSDSGAGAGALLPRELYGFNWGALVCPVLRALFNGQFTK